jgi:hypothetical protein
MLTTSASISIYFDGAADGAFTLPTLPASTLNFVPYINATANVQLNSHSLIADTVKANTVISNEYIQFSDGSKQYTANAGSGGTTDQYARDTANAGFTKANTVANTAQAAFDKANTDVTNVNVTNGTYGNSTYTPIVTVAANGRVTNITTVETSGSSGGTTNFGDYFPQNTDWGYYDDELYSAFGESLLIKYDCRIDPITPSGYTLTKDFGYIT